MNVTNTTRYLFLFMLVIAAPAMSFAQGTARASARMDANRIVVGDGARLFIEVHHNPATTVIRWPVMADTFNSLEITEKGKIDTIRQGGEVAYRQRLVITGFDSGVFKVPAFQFAVIPKAGDPYVIQTDSFQLLVQTVAVDTTKDFKPVKNILLIQPPWWEKYLWWIAAAMGLVLVSIIIAIYLSKNKKKPVPKPKEPVVPLQDRVLKQLAELEAKELWQKSQVKQYYVELTDIVRNYIEARFNTPAMELTTDELLFKVQHHKELQPYTDILSSILHTADLAKFAKWQPLPQEHFDAMERARKFVDTSRPQAVVTETKTEQNNG